MVDHDLGDRIPVNCLIAKRDYLLLVSRGNAATTQNRAHIVSLCLSDPDHNLVPNFVRGPILILGENEEIRIGRRRGAPNQQHVARGKNNRKEEKGYGNRSNSHCSDSSPHFAYTVLPSPLASIPFPGCRIFGRRAMGAVCKSDLAPGVAALDSSVMSGCSKDPFYRP